MKIKRGDQVLVIAGKERGKTGEVLQTFPKEDALIIRGIARVKHHVKPSPKHPQGGIIEQEAPIQISRVMLLCGNCKKATRIGYKGSKRGKIRLCKKCGAEIERRQ